MCSSSTFLLQVVVEYLEEAFAGPPLMPREPARRAWVRQWTAFAGDKIIPFYYKMLMAQEEPGRQDAKDALLLGLKEWSSAMSGEGPFFLGSEFSFADIAVGPWFQRILTVSKAYRDFHIPTTTEYARLWTWWAAVKVRESFAHTIVDEERLVQNYSGYADNSATSTEAKKHRL